MQKLNSKLIAIVILNWNGTRDTIECLNSILRFLTRKVYKVILIDNNSTEDIEDLRRYEDEMPLQIIRLKKNIGFAAGNNVGIYKALKEKFEYIWLLNNDTVLVDDSVYNLVNHLNSTENIGIGGLVNYYFSDPDLIWQAGFKNDLRNGNVHPINNFNPNDNRLYFVDYVPGSSFLVKREVFEKIGFLDYKYFAYFEENDFCVRAKRSGYQIAFLQNSKILHKVGRSSENHLKIYLRTRNRLLFYFKYSGRINFLYIFIKYSLKTVYKLIKLKKNRSENLQAFVFSNIDFYKGNFYKGSFYKF